MNKKYLYLLIIIDVVIFGMILVIKYFTDFGVGIFIYDNIGLYSAAVIAWAIGTGFICSLIPMWRVYDWPRKIDSIFIFSIIIIIVGLVVTIYGLIFGRIFMYGGLGTLNFMLAFKLLSNERPIF